VPIGFYLLKTSAVEAPLRSGLRFFGVFAVAMGVLVFPYIHLLPGFIAGFLVPNSAGVAAAVADPIANPIGFGLSYWSVYLLNRFASISLTTDLVYALSIFSTVLVLASLLFVYWKTSKLTFKKPVFDLTLAMLLSVTALFLSLRFVCEQWLIWALPSLIFLCIAGRVKTSIYWAISLIAFIFAMLNCLLPFFFLPLGPWLSVNLLPLTVWLMSVWEQRIVVLAVLSFLFSTLLLILFVDLLTDKFFPKTVLVDSRDSKSMRVFLRNKLRHVLECLRSFLRRLHGKLVFSWSDDVLICLKSAR
jgi:hypothetical protein